MEHRDKPNPETGTESDISKAQAQQQPPAETGQAGADSSQFETRSQDPSQQDGSASTGEATGGFDQNDTLTQQRTDIEGSALGAEPTGEGSSFVGSKGDADASSELVDKEQQFRKDGQGAPDRE